MDNGSCCTMALFNFIANKGGSPTTTRILDDVSAYCRFMGYSNLKTDHISYRSIYMLSMLRTLQPKKTWSYCPFIIMLSAVVILIRNIATKAVHFQMTAPWKGIGMFLLHTLTDMSGRSIVPKTGVEGAFCLGGEGTDWTSVAQTRLEQWTYAAWATQIHNDVHVIVAEVWTLFESCECKQIPCQSYVHGRPTCNRQAFIATLLFDPSMSTFSYPCFIRMRERCRFYFVWGCCICHSQPRVSTETGTELLLTILSKRLDIKSFPN